MAVELYANNAVTTLNGAINNSVTSLTLTSSTGFPAAVTGTAEFRIAIDTELLLVTNRTGAVCIVTRGIEGTTAASHANGASVSVVLTAASLPRNNPQYLVSGQQLFNASDGLMYSNGAVFVDVNNTLFYGGGQELSDASGNLYYGNGAIESDAIGQLYYSSGNLFVDNLGQIYSNGNLFVDISGNIYARNGNIVIDFNGNIYYAPGAPVFSSGFTGANPFLIYPNAGVGSALADANGNLYYGNGTFPTPGSVLADANGLLYPGSFSSAPSYVEGALYYDTTLNKLRVGGASGWETVTSV